MSRHEEELEPSVKHSLIALYIATHGALHTHHPKEFVAKTIPGGYFDYKSLLNKKFARRGSGDSLYITKLGVQKAESMLGIPPRADRATKHKIIVAWKKESRKP